MFCSIISANCFGAVVKNDKVCENVCACTFCSLLVESFIQGNEIDEQAKNPSTE